MANDIQQIGSPFPGFPSGGISLAGAPDLFVPFDEKKKPAFGLEFARGLESMYLFQSGLSVGNDPKGRNAVNYMYGTGDQPYTQAVRPLDSLTGNDAQTIFGGNTSNMQILPSIITAIVGKLIKRQYKPSVTLIDALSIMDRRDFQTQLEMVLQAKKQNADVAMYLEKFGLTPEDVPIDDTEVQLRIETMPQFEFEMNLELALQDIGHDNRIEVLRKMVLENFVIASSGGIYINRKGGKRQLEILDPLTSGTSFSIYEDGRESAWFYRLKLMPLEQVRVESQPYLTDDQLKQLRGGQFSLLANGMYSWMPYGGAPAYYSTNNYVDMVLTMDFQFISTDTGYINEKDGKLFPLSYKPKKNGADGKVQTVKVQNLFGGTFIPGTDKIYGYGVKEDAIRQTVVSGAAYRNLDQRIVDPIQAQQQAMENTLADAGKVNTSKVYSDFIFYKVNSIRGVSKSLVDIARPHIDSIQQNFNKFRDYMQEFIPWLLVIDEAALASIITQEGGDPVSADDFLATAIARGQIIGNSANLKNIYNASFENAFQLKANEGGENLQMLWNMLLQQINLLRDVLGVSNVELGAQVEGGQGKAVTQMQVAGTENVLAGISFAEKQLFEMLYENLGWDILHTGANGVLGTKPFLIPKGNPDERIPKFICEVLPTEQEWADLLSKAEVALETGTLTLDEYAYLKLSINNLRQAWVYLGIRKKRNEMAQAAATQANEAANTDRLMATAQAASDAKLREIEAQNVADLRLKELEIYGKVFDTYAKTRLETDKTLDLQKLKEEFDKIMYGDTRQQPTEAAGSTSIAA